MTRHSPLYGQILRKLREARGLTQAEVARRAGISPAQLTRLETNQRGLYLQDFIRIAEVLGEKAGNLLPNDLGDIGHVKPLIDVITSVKPEYLPHVSTIIDRVVLLTNDVAIHEDLKKKTRPPQRPSAKNRTRG